MWGEEEDSRFLPGQIGLDSPADVKLENMGQPVDLGVSCSLGESSLPQCTWEP